MASAALDFICFNDFGIKDEQREWKSCGFKNAMIGLDRDEIIFTDLERFPELVDEKNRRPREQWWLDLVTPLEIVGQEGTQEEQNSKL